VMHEERDLHLGELMAQALAALDAGDAAAVDRAIDAAGDDRAELLDMVELALSLRGPRLPAAAEIDALAADPAFDVRAWSEILAPARHAAGVRRPDLVARLADRLGLRAGPARERLALRYHELETGQLAATGVQPPLLDALGDLLGGLGATLRATQRNPTFAPGRPALSFHRSAPEPEPVLELRMLADADADVAPDDDERAVDALFGL
jgi:hypothetical protein